MAFTITLGFATEHDRDAFVERVIPRLRGHEVEPTAPAEDDGLHRAAVAVTSQSAARDVCHHVAGSLAHAKNARVDVFWSAADGEEQMGQVTAGAGREVDRLAIRVGAAAKAHLDAEKEAQALPAPEEG